MRKRLLHFFLIFFLTVLGTYLFSKDPGIRHFFTNLGVFSFLAAFLTGLLFISFFTVATGAAIFLLLAETTNPLTLILLGGLGAVLGDMVIYLFVKKNLISEIEDVYKTHGGNHLYTLFHTKYFHWLLPVFGAILLAQPFPDRLGVSIVHLAHMKLWRFILYAFLIDSLAISLVLLAYEISHF